MKAVRCTKYGPPEVLEMIEAAKPVPGADDVLVKIHASAVTNSDIFIRSSKVNPGLLLFFRLAIGIFRPRQKVIGIVFSGTVESVGSGTTKYAVGDQVYGMTGFSLGTYAEYTCMKEYDSKRYGCMAKKPKNIAHEEATAICYGGLLGFQAMEKQLPEKGEKVLIYGASGTAGTVAIQYAKYLGATVTAVCSSKNRELVTELGADKHLNYTDNSAVEHLERYDLVVDAVGKAKTSELRRAAEKSLTPGGRTSSIDDETLLLDSQRLTHITELTEQGILQAVLDKTFPLEEIVAAHHYVESGHKVGGVAIRIV